MHLRFKIFEMFHRLPRHIKAIVLSNKNSWFVTFHTVSMETSNQTTTIHLHQFLTYKGRTVNNFSEFCNMRKWHARYGYGQLHISSLPIETTLE